MGRVLFFSGPEYFSHLEGNISFTCQPVGWSDVYGESQSQVSRLQVDKAPAHTRITVESGAQTLNK